MENQNLTPKKSLYRGKIKDNKFSPILRQVKCEVLANKYMEELDRFSSWFTPETNIEVIRFVFDKLFDAKYLKTTKDGGRRIWKI